MSPFPRKITFGRIAALSASAVIALLALQAAASAQNFFGDNDLRPPGSIFGPSQVAPAPTDDVETTGSISNSVTAPGADVGAQADADGNVPSKFRRQLVRYNTPEIPGTIVIDTANTFLYLVLGHGEAIRYGVGVGRDGFRWSGRKTITRTAEWPDWRPPHEMIERQPYLPRFMAGGPGNPLGARALYLGSTVYRIHGTSEPNTIGTFVSSGCIRLVNDDVIDLYQRVGVGTNVVVLPAASASLH